MPKSKIKFYQEGSKEINEDGEIEITWLIINDSEFTLEKVRANSQINCHDFGNIGPQTKVSFKFSYKIPSIDILKEDFGEDVTVSNPFFVGSANLIFTIKTDTFEIDSNSLEIPF